METVFINLKIGFEATFNVKKSISKLPEHFYAKNVKIKVKKHVILHFLVNSQLG